MADEVGSEEKETPVPMADLRAAVLEMDGAEAMDMDPGRFRTWWQSHSRTQATRLEAEARIQQRIVAKSNRKTHGREDVGMTRDQLLDIQDERGINAFERTTLKQLQEAYGLGADKAQRLGRDGQPVSDADIKRAVNQVMSGEGKGGKGTLLKLGGSTVAGALGGASLGAAAQTGRFFLGFVPGTKANRDKHNRKNFREAAKVNRANGDIERLDQGAEMAEKYSRNYIMQFGKYGAVAGLGGGLILDGRHANDEAAVKDAIELGIRADLEARGVEVEARRSRDREEDVARSDAGYAASDEAPAAQYERRTLQDQIDSGETLISVVDKIRKVRGLPETEQTAGIEKLFAPNDLKTIDVDRSSIVVVSADGSTTPLAQNKRNQQMAILPEGLSTEEMQAELEIMKKYAPDVQLVQVDGDGGKHYAFLGISGKQATAYSAYAAAEETHVKIIGGPAEAKAEEMVRAAKAGGLSVGAPDGHSVLGDTGGVVVTVPASAVVGAESAGLDPQALVQATKQALDDLAPEIADRVRAKLQAEGPSKAALPAGAHKEPAEIGRP